MERVRGFEKISKEQFIEDFCDEFVQSEVVAEDVYKQIKLPRRATLKSAGIDVYSPIDFELQPNQDIKIPTGFKVYMLDDENIDFYPRSSHGFKYYVRLANTVGIGDSDYYNNKGNEGHYWVKIRNEGNKTLKVKQGETFAQGIFRKYLLPDNDNPVDQERVGGLGSTTK